MRARSLFCFPNMALETQWQKQRTACMCPSTLFPSRRFLEAIVRTLMPVSFAKAKKSIRRTFTSSALPFPQSKSPEGLIFLGLLLPCYQQLWQACIGPLWHRCKYWLYVSNHSSSSEMSLGWACVLTVVPHCLIVKTGTESPLYINDFGVPPQNRMYIYSVRTHIHMHDIHPYICDDNNQNLKLYLSWIIPQCQDKFYFIYLFF